MALRRARERRLPLGRVGERRGVVNVENLVRVAPLLFGSTHQQQSLGIEVVKMAVFQETGGLPVLEFFSLSLGTYSTNIAEQSCLMSCAISQTRGASTNFNVLFSKSRRDLERILLA